MKLRLVKVNGLRNIVDSSSYVCKLSFVCSLCDMQYHGVGCWSCGGV